MVCNLFGFHALQICSPWLDALRANRIQKRWLVDDAVYMPKKIPDTLAYSAALPFEQGSMDVLACPHTLDLSVNAQQSVREMYRVLRPEGKIVLTGFNPYSLWAWRHRRGTWAGRFGTPYLPHMGRLISHWRLRDWLTLLGFEIELCTFGCHLPAMSSEKGFERFLWLQRSGQRLWPVLGAVYLVVAHKRVAATRLISPAWKKKHIGLGRPSTAPASAAQNTRKQNRTDPHSPSTLTERMGP